MRKAFLFVFIPRCHIIRHNFALYKGFVVFVQGPCSDATKPL